MIPLRMSDPIIGILRGYAIIFFLSSPWVGAIFLLSTFWFFNAGLSGLLAAVMAIAIARVMNFVNWSSGLHIYNSILIGLSLGFVYKLDGYLVVIIGLAAALTVFLTVTLTESLWRLERLPALSLPFVLVVLITTLATKSYGSLSHYLYPYAPQQLVTWELGDVFFRALGATFFMPHPIPGILIFFALLCSSRYMVLLAVSGFLVGHFFQYMMLDPAFPYLGSLNEFNFILTAVALGGIFTVPSWQGFTLALCSSALVAMVSTALQNVMPLFGLTILPGSFLLVTLTSLAALGKRADLTVPVLLLGSPALPEVSMERARLAKARAVTTETIPVLLPFLGEWSIYQGFNGPYTHKTPWQHSLDFIIVSEGRSYRNDGQLLEDFYCFGLPVVSPVYGQVTACTDLLADNQPGEVDIQHNWGNYLSINCGNGVYVVLAHIQQHSLEVAEGDYLVPGQRLARCGNSGRSPQPHIHLHVQRGPVLGSATIPFHLSYVMLRRPEYTQFYLATIPTEAVTVMAAVSDEKLVSALHLPVGRCLLYRFRVNGRQWVLRRLTASLTLAGQFRLVADSGASAAFIETKNILAFYDRTGPKDLFLDLWLLHFGLTPLVGGKFQWRDSPSIKLLPLTLIESIFYNLSTPFLSGVKSTYSRYWDVAESGWVQTGNHERAFIFRREKPLETRAVITPEQGCTSMRLEIGDILIEADIQASGLSDDVGIPGINTGLA